MRGLDGGRNGSEAACRDCDCACQASQARIWRQDGDTSLASSSDRECVCRLTRREGEEEGCHTWTGESSD